MILWRRLAAIVAEHGAAALVSVHEVKGSTPREAGARMIVRPDGAFHGTIGGGGLEWAMLREARAALAQGRGPARLIEQALGPDLGQCCGGWVRVRVETFDHGDLSDLEAFARAEGEGPFGVECRIGDDGRVARALPSHPEGGGAPRDRAGEGPCSQGMTSPLPGAPPSPQGRATRRSRAGWGVRRRRVLGPALRALGPALQDALRATPHPCPSPEGREVRLILPLGARGRTGPLPTRTDAEAPPRAEARRQAHSHPGGGRRWRETYGAALTPVLLFGAGHVGRALVLALAPLPFAVRWIDSREDAFPAHIPANATTARTDELEGEVAHAPADSLVLVMTHDHALDLVVTAAALRRDFPFVGLIGSATKRARFERRLRELGIPDERIRSLVCPIGLPGIGGKEPAVIAASVTAQLLAERERIAALSEPPADRLRQSHDNALSR